MQTEPFKSYVTIYYEDTDFSGVVYYANYMKYFERARSEFFGLPALVKMWQETGIGFAVYRAELQYKEGARFGDVLEIHTIAKRESEYRVVCEQTAHKNGSNVPMVKGSIQMVCVNTEQKLVPLPDRVRDMLRVHGVD